MLPQGSLATFLSSYHSNLCPTAWKPHTSTPKRGYQVFLPPGLGLDTSYLAISHHGQCSTVIPSLPANQGGSWTQFHKHAEDGDAGNHVTQSAQASTLAMWKQRLWLFSYGLHDFSKIITSISPFPTCEMGTNVACPREGHCRPKGKVRYQQLSNSHCSLFNSLVRL